MFTTSLLSIIKWFSIRCTQAYSFALTIHLKSLRVMKLKIPQLMYQNIDVLAHGRYSGVIYVIFSHRPLRPSAPTPIMYAYVYVFSCTRFHPLTSSCVPPVYPYLHFWLLAYSFIAISLHIQTHLAFNSPRCLLASSSVTGYCTHPQSAVIFSLAVRWSPSLPSFTPSHYPYSDHHQAAPSVLVNCSTFICSVVAK